MQCRVLSSGSRGNCTILRAGDMTLAEAMREIAGATDRELQFVETSHEDFVARELEIDHDVGAVVVATGFDELDPRELLPLGYGRAENVLTGLEFERLCHASGPTEGHIVTRKDGKEPSAVAIVHCIGSRDQNYHEYCSRVCCMYSLKFAHLVKEKLPGATCYQFYIDMRAFGKGYEEFFERIKDELRNGRTIKNAAPRSFKMTWRTIWSADVVSLIAAFILFWLSVGSVRGFALYLGLTTICDLLVCYFFTRPAILLLARSKLMARQDKALGIQVATA